MTFIKDLPDHVHRNGTIHRILIMDQGQNVAFEDAGSLAIVMVEERRQRILDMTAALSAIFGNAALPIAVGQPGDLDVGGRSGIRWQDLADALCATQAPGTVDLLGPYDALLNETNTSAA